jgi:hypothetical protein
MYGTMKDNILNSTLFIQNSSDTMYNCIDATENLYVFFVYKMKMFGYDWINVLLGWLQNALKQVFYISSIYGKIIEYDKA